MFHLDNNKRKGYLRNEIRSIIVVKVESLLIGLVVDEIQSVISLREDDIQPPSPLLGSINEKYIKGVIKIEEKLCVIFDTDSIFIDKTKSKKEILPQVSDLSEEFFVYFCNQIEVSNLYYHLVIQSLQIMDFGTLLSIIISLRRLLLHNMLCCMP